MLGPMNPISITDLRAEAEALTAGLPAGDALDALSAALVELAVAVSVTALDRAIINEAVRSAMGAGATIGQIQEIIALVSGLGVHSLMVSSVEVLEEAAKRGLAQPADPLDAERQLLWDKHVDRDAWGEFREGEIAQQPYVYQNKTR